MSKELSIDQLSKIELVNIILKASIMWKDYFATMDTEYKVAYNLMSQEEQKTTIKMLTQTYLEYKYNPPPEDEEANMFLYPYYKYTINKDEINLITLSLNDVFAT